MNLRVPLLDEEELAPIEAVRLPDTNTRLTVRYAYEGEEGLSHQSTLTLNGENAEHGPFMLRAFKGFLRSQGFTLRG
jgi:hypothetical protein